MSEILGYKTLKLLYKTEHINTYRGIKEDTNEEVIIKMPLTLYSRALDETVLKDEYKLQQKLYSNSEIRFIEVKKAGKMHSLIIEKAGTLSLSEYINQKDKMPIDTFINLAIEMVMSLRELHKNGYIHTGLNSEIFLINRENFRVYLSDFSHSIKAIGTDIDYNSLKNLSLQYVAPEQIGIRIEPIDYRTDIYSLGVIFYQMITKQLPIDKNELESFVLEHFTKNIEHPLYIRGDVPGFLSSIIMKCLNKHQEHRYQSINGLLNDLISFKEQYIYNKSFEILEIGNRDIPSVFKITDKQYGREKEKDVIFKAFENAKGGAKEVIFIHGESGIGKTSLVEGIREKKGKDSYFAVGRYDTIRSDIPYIPFVQAIENLLQYVLIESKEEMEDWKILFLKTLGSNAPIITKYLPSMEIILGSQPKVEVVPSLETRDRLLASISSIIKVFLQKKKPVVIFMDDLQWAEKGSLIILESIVTDPNLRGLLFIGTCSSNKGSKELLFDTIKDMEKKNPSIKNLYIEGISIHDTNQMIIDTFYCTENESYELAKVLHYITRGNPYYFKELFNNLYTKGIIWYDFDGDRWLWDINTIKTFSGDENIQNYILYRIKNLPIEIKEFLKFAACLGTSFSKDIIQGVLELSEEKYKSLMMGLTTLGILHEQSNNSIGFFDAKLAQSFYETIDEKERKTIHHHIGSFLLDFYSEKEEEKILEIVNQLNYSRDIITDKEKKFNLARLNFRAGKRSANSMAFNVAIIYFKIGLELLGEDPWGADRNLAFEMYYGLYECSYLVGDLKTADDIFNILIGKARTLEEKGNIYLAKIFAYFRTGRQDEGIEICLNLLNDFNIRTKKNPSRFSILIQYLITKPYVLDMNIRKILSLPDEDISQREFTDVEKVINSIYLALITMGYTTAPNIMVYLSLMQLRHFLKGKQYENIPGGLVAYSVLVMRLSKDYNRGFEIGKLALRLDEKWNKDIANRGINYFVFASLIHHWKEHAEATEEYFLNAISYCTESGNPIFAGFSISHYISSLHVRGVHLEKLFEQIEHYSKYNHYMNHRYLNDFLSLYRQFTLCLLGRTHSPLSFGDENISESILMERLRSGDERERKIFDYNLCKLQIYYFMGNYEETLKIAKESEVYEDRANGTIALPEFYFYYCLSILASYHVFNLKERHMYTKALKKKIRAMKIWAKCCPENFGHKYLLILAESNRVRKKFKSAAFFYDQAIISARNNNYIQNASLGYELAAKFYYEWSMKTTGNVYMVLAYRGFESLGATIKVRSLEEEFPWILETKDIVWYKHNITMALDKSTIIKTYQTITEEIVLEELLKKILTILIQNAGADKCLLFLYKDNNLHLEGVGKVIEDKIDTEVLQSIELKDCENAPKSIINYVATTNELVIKNNISQGNIFTKDPFLSKNNIKSVICMPIIHQSKSIGILYLENNLVEGVFSASRIELLKIISSQLAISIENARLYSELQELNTNLEEKVLERTRKLEQSQKEIATALAERSILEERTRIAREVHDTVGHTLTSVNMQIEAGKRLIRKDTVLAVEKLEQSQEQIRLGLNNIRKSLHMLKEGDLREEFIPTLESFIQDTMKNTGITIMYDISYISNLSSPQRYILYRALQEGITNGIRHGRSNYFDFSLKQHNDKIVFILKDQGIGAENIKFGFGLTSMRDRVLELSGEFEAISKQGEGVTIIIKIPIDY